MVSEHTPFGRVESGDVEKTLKNFGELLVKSELATDVDIEKVEGGFYFKVDGCIFAEHVHDLLNPRDVTCPYGLLVQYLAEKSSGKRVMKSLSDFTPTETYTLIRFVEKS